MRTLGVLMIGLLIAAGGCSTPTAPVLPPPTPTPVQPDQSGVILSPGTPVAIPALVEGTVRDADPTCFRNWDATGRCVFFAVTAPSDGRLTATLRWTSKVGMDVFYLVGGLMTHAEGGGLVLSVKEGQEVTMVVMSYAAPQDFTFETSLQP